MADLRREGHAKPKATLTQVRDARHAHGGEDDVRPVAPSATAKDSRGARRSVQADRRLSLAEAETLAADIAAADPNVEYAEPDYILRAQFTPNDTRYDEQSQLFEFTGGINVPAAWDRATGSGVVVAVVDTGYRPHADMVIGCPRVEA